MDRSTVRDRIERAVADGRITSADAEIRLRNVDSAQSEAELDLIVRDLDQLEAAIAPTQPAYATSAADIAAASSGSVRRSWPVLAAVIGMVVAIAGALAVFAFSGSDSGQQVTELGDPIPIASGSPGAETPSPAESPDASQDPAAPAYSLTPDGVRTFIRTYRDRFGTTRAVTATFYGDYVVVQVPVSGKARHTGWVYRQASGFTDFGGTSANFPGSATVDLAKLDLAALFKNVSLAKRVLKVEDANQTYVNIDYRPDFDPAPNVNIYLSNEFNESGYLATRMNGRVERSYPFGG